MKEIIKEIEEKIEKQKPLDLPVRGSPPRMGIKIQAPIKNRWGFSLKVAMRQVAKSLPEYKRVIIHKVSGRDDNGNEIPINTLGRWIWGVPGYMGNAVFDGGAEMVTVWVPREAPPEAIALIKKAMERL